MEDVRETAFELERFAWTPPGRLEVVGRWNGLEGRRLGRPVLTLEAHGIRRRLGAVPGGHFARAASGEWRAAFAYDDDPEAITRAELELGRRLVVELPRPRRRRGAPPEALEDERRLRLEAETTLAERDAEIIGLRDEAETAIGDREAEIETLRTQLTQAEQLAAARDDAERRAAEFGAELAIAREELATARQELETARSEADERLAAQRAAAAEVHEKLAAAREEAHRTIETEAEETERLRAELAAAREETERTVSAEREETERLREELASRAAHANGSDGGEAEAAARRMYERVARELENERTAARHLRRELDAVQAQSAEHRRVVSAAVTDSVTPTAGGEPAAPGATTPAGRVAAARRAGAGRAAAHQRAEAARAAAAHRVPGHRSAAAVWAVRAVAVAIVAALLVALLLIVSAVT
jgi:hypothetical protein